MSVLALVLFVISMFLGAVLFAQYHSGLRQGDDRKRVWQLVEDLQNDNRALMESLCRAEGKPFIPAGKRETVPSDGWFDGKPRITVVETRKAS